MNPWRQVHLDFHTSPLIPGVGSLFDARAFADQLVKAKVQSINLFAKCHHGLYYYPTALGRMHPSLGFDLLGAQVAACREAGIRTLVYDCVVWAEDIADRHPGWLQVDAAGVAGMKPPFTAGIGSWRSLCLAEPGLVELVKAELAEVHRLYRPQGFWIDIVIQFGCVCPRCRAEITAAGSDPRDPLAVARHDREVEIRFAREIRGFLGALDPGLEVFFNGFAYEMDNVDDPDLSAARKRDLVTFVDVESLPSDDWGYAHFPVIANYLDTRGRTRDVTMMNGRFHTAWGDFGSLRNREALEYECFRAAAAGARCCVGDQLHPRGVLDPAVYERIGGVFRALESREPWLEGTRKVSEVGVIADAPVVAAGIKERLKGNATAEGAWRMLTETHRLLDFLDFTDDLAPYPLVILADSVTLTDAAAAKLAAYHAAGGRLLVTGTAGMDRGRARFLLDALGIRYGGPAAFTPRYARLEPGTFPGVPPMDHVLYAQGTSVTPLPGARVRAGIVDPFFNRTWEHFCSHRHTPPDAPGVDPLVVTTERTAYAAHPLFSDYVASGCRVYRDVVTGMIELLAGSPLVQSTLPSTAEISVRERGADWILHVLHYIIQRKCRALETVEEAIPLVDTAFSVRSPRPPARVVLQPEGRPIASRWENGRCSFILPRVEGWQVVVLEGAA